jgi:hypothetical protein
MLSHWPLATRLLAAAAAAAAACSTPPTPLPPPRQGDRDLLKKEIQRLNTELDQLRKGQADPAVAENAELRQRLEE